jgi:hypothetical protein
VEALEGQRVRLEVLEPFDAPVGRQVLIFEESILAEVRLVDAMVLLVRLPS